MNTTKHFLARKFWLGVCFTLERWLRTYEHSHKRMSKKYWHMQKLYAFAESRRIKAETKVQMPWYLLDLR